MPSTEVEATLETAAAGSHAMWVLLSSSIFGYLFSSITYIIYGESMEIMSLDSLIENHGIGTLLLEQVIEEAKRIGCKKIVLITTNDNINAIRFYQKRGFDMACLFRNAMAVSRKMKPEIPLIGDNSIPLRHEIEFEMVLK